MEWFGERELNPFVWEFLRERKGNKRGVDGLKFPIFFPKVGCKEKNGKGSFKIFQKYLFYP